MKVELEVPKGYERYMELSTKEWKESFRVAFTEALEKAVNERVAFKFLKRLAKKSKLTDEQARELSDEIKEGIAKRHGL